MIAARHATILIAEDDPDDRLLARDALAESQFVGTMVRFVEDGQELLDYLRRRGKFSDPAVSPTPGIVLIDLNMPRMDGRTAIAAMKGDPALRHIPVTVLTTSSAEEDISRSYQLGVNSYITKPVSFESLVRVMKSVSQYWFEIVELPA
jgi:CheY-like chemotaxis protein